MTCRFPKSEFSLSWNRKVYYSEKQHSAKKPVQRKYLAKIFVTLRPSVLDPAGVAVKSGLKQLGYDRVEQVRIGKYIEVTLISQDDKTARQEVDSMCDQMLANTVIENYRFDLIEVETQTGVS
jgi:phosphoribosylformylglycinamidine synthase subunit PurS